MKLACVYGRYDLLLRVIQSTFRFMIIIWCCAVFCVCAVPNVPFVSCRPWASIVPMGKHISELSLVQSRLSGIYLLSSQGFMVQWMGVLCYGCAIMCPGGTTHGTLPHAVRA